MDFKKTIKRILFFGILLGLLMVVIGELFHLSEGTVFFILILSYVVFMMIVIPYQIRKTHLLNHKMELLLKQLYQGNVENYITGMNELLAEAENDYLKAVLTINMSIGYTFKGDFKTAITHLESIDASTIDKRNQIVLYHNIASNTFFAGETKKACVIMELHQNELKKGLESPYLKNNLYETFALWYFAKGKREQGFEYLENILNDENAKEIEKQSAKLIWAREKIADKEQMEQSKQILQEIVSDAKMPYLKKEAETLLKQ